MFLLNEKNKTKQNKPQKKKKKSNKHGQRQKSIDLLEHKTLAHSRGRALCLTRWHWRAAGSNTSGWGWAEISTCRWDNNNSQIALRTTVDARERASGSRWGVVGGDGGNSPEARCNSGLYQRSVWLFGLSFRLGSGGFGAAWDEAGAAFADDLILHIVLDHLPRTQMQKAEGRPPRLYLGNTGGSFNTVKPSCPLANCTTSVWPRSSS